MEIITLVFFAFVTIGLIGLLEGVCPLCTVAVGAGIGVSRWFGIHDAIAGIWIGGFLLALSWWFNTLLRKYTITFTGYRFFVPVLVYAFTGFSLWWLGSFGICRLVGINCLVIGVLIGSVSFALGEIGSCMLKKRNNNKALFGFQKVIIPWATLLLVSLFMYVVV